MVLSHKSTFVPLVGLSLLFYIRYTSDHLGIMKIPQQTKDSKSKQS